MQQKITQSNLLLDRDGNLTAEGWSYNNLLKYSRDFVKNNTSLLTERDTYYISNKACAIYITLTKRGKKSSATFIFIDFAKGMILQKTVEINRLFGKAVFSSTSTDDNTSFDAKDCKIKIIRKENHSAIKGVVADISGYNLVINLELQQTSNTCLSTAKTFSDKKGCFVYKNFIPLFSVNGSIDLDSEKYDISSEHTAGWFSWIRGTIPNNTKLQSLYVNKLSSNNIAMYLSNDFGSIKKCTDNFLIYANAFMKIDEIKATCLNGDSLSTWKFCTDDGAVDVEFNPLVSRGKPVYLTYENRILIIGFADCYAVGPNDLWVNNKQFSSIVELEVF